jgi:hypothetical protein
MIILGLNAFPAEYDRGRRRAASPLDPGDLLNVIAALIDRALGFKSATLGRSRGNCTHPKAV